MALRAERSGGKYGTPVTRAVEFTSKDDHLAWLRTWRDHTATMLAEYVPGTKRAFNELGTDATDLRKARLQRELEQIDAMIEKAECDA